VQYDEFIGRVVQRAGVSREYAAILTQGTLQALADRISGGQAADLEAQLPASLARPLRTSPQKPAKNYGFDEFVARVRDLAVSVPDEAVLPGIRAVMLTLRDSVGDKEFRDTMAQLPDKFGELLQEEGGPEAAQPAAAGAAAREDALVLRIAERAGVSAEAAALLTQATLEVLGDRIGGSQAHDLAQRLPDTSGQWLDEPQETPAQDYGVDDFVSRVRDRASGVQDDDITPGIQAVLISLRDAVGEGEVEIALRPLPGEYDELLARTR
jgi:uncharacterized protein (DUF2267 family)